MGELEYEDQEVEAPRHVSEDDPTLGHKIAGAVGDTIEATRDRISATREQLIEALAQSVGEIKPKFRGYFHLYSIPFAFIGGLFLLIFSDTVAARASLAVFVACSVMLFSISATYHRTNGWISPRMTRLLQKADHTSISLLIAGTNTPFAVLLMEGQQEKILLIGMWTATFISILTKWLWAHPPRWVNVPIYVGLGWFPIFFMSSLWQGAMEVGPNAGPTIFSLIVIGGVLYTIGGILFGLRPRWLELKPGVFSFHEVFHGFTVIAFLCHYIAISLVAYMV